jgi:hypothetical protein
LELKELAYNSAHTETHSTYSIVVGPLGERYLQIDTYGSSERQLEGKKSQSIRFTSEAAVELAAILAAFHAKA